MARSSVDQILVAVHLGRYYETLRIPFLHKRRIKEEFLKQYFRTFLFKLRRNFHLCNSP